MQDPSWHGRWIICLLWCEPSTAIAAESHKAAIFMHVRCILALMQDGKDATQYTMRVHTYSPQWALQGKDYEAVSYSFPPLRCALAYLTAASLLLQELLRNRCITMLIKRGTGTPHCCQNRRVVHSRRLACSDSESNLREFSDAEMHWTCRMAWDGLSGMTRFFSGK
jgi:hypothetical protein